MELYEIPRQPVADPFRGELGTLIETVGTPRFPAQLMRLADEVACCGHVSAFALPDTSAPRLLLAANRGPSSVAHAAGTAYLSHFWDRDPINTMTLPAAAVDTGVVVRVTSHEFLNTPYRRAIYSAQGWSSSGAHLIERLSLLKRHRAELMRINFYRSREAGPFTPGDIDHLISAADLLFALVARHGQMGLPPQKADSRTSYEDILRRIAPDLSKREVEVCAGIALGMTSEAIASTLGIGINTVVTYRKRAYARLRISSHNELLRTVFSAATTLGFDAGPILHDKAAVDQPARSQWSN